VSVFVWVCRHYLWVDERGKKCKCTAPQYVDYVMSYSQKCISDEAVFPTKYGNTCGTENNSAITDAYNRTYDTKFNVDSKAEYTA